jgi:hypothetical protein
MPSNAQERAALVARLRELATAVTQGREAVLREFTMRIPAEPTRDADLVLSTAADLLEALAASEGAQATGEAYAPAWRCGGCGHGPHGGVCFGSTSDTYVCRCEGQPVNDVVCQHGTAADVHCCNCHGGFLFCVATCSCTSAPAAVREPEGRPATVAEIKALEGNGIVQAAPPLPEPSEAQCEGGVTVRWCPKCGRCTCPAQNEKPDGWEENPTCPIHGDASTHGEPSEALEALAADVVNRFNPIAGHIVLRDLVLAALARVKGQ